MGDSPVTPSSVLDYWFGSSTDEAVTAKEKQRLWWGKDAAIDEDIRACFGDALERAGRGELDHWADTPRGSLALIVLMDQFSRNMHRGTPRSFAFDAAARSVTRRVIDAGQDRELRPIERVFMYLPFEHSESIDDQDRAVALFGRLRDEAPVARRATFAGYLDYAHRHREVIARFGRFPHRNAILGRTSTAEETAFLSQPGSSF